MVRKWYSKSKSKLKSPQKTKTYFHPVDSKKYKTLAEKDLPIVAMLLQKIQTQLGNNVVLFFN